MATIKLLPKLVIIAATVGAVIVAVSNYPVNQKPSTESEQTQQKPSTDGLIMGSLGINVPQVVKKIDSLKEQEQPKVAGVVHDGDKKMVQEQTGIEIPQPVNSPLHMNAGLEKLMQAGSKK